MNLRYFSIFLLVYTIKSSCLKGYTVHDAGTSFINGCYVLNGSAFGSPRYVLLTNATYSIYRYDKIWTIGVEGKDACYKAYRVASQVPPCIGWSVASSGQIFCPDVSIGTPTLTGPPNASASSPVKPCATFPPTPPPTPLPPMRLVWEDNFNGMLNESTWNVLEQVHRGGVYTRENVYIENGSLVLRTVAQNISVGDKKYFVSSGAVNTSNNFAQRLGRWEIRAKMPDVDRTLGYILHSSFWLYSPGEKGTSGCGQEIDILEQYAATSRNISKASTLKGTIHAFSGGSGQPCKRLGGGTFSTTTADYTSDWHIYTVDWTTNLLRIQVDGHTIGTFAESDILMSMTDSLYTLLTACVMKQTPPTEHDIFPQHYYIDYVKVWEWNSDKQ